MPREPSQKGTSFVPVVAALKARPDAKAGLPRAQWKYLEEHLVIAGWYPERDYFVLVDALVKTIDPKTVGGDVWRYFASFSARRDIGGEDVGGARNAAVKGVYKSFAAQDAAEPEPFFRRAAKLWSQYHDTGAMQIRGGSKANNSVIMQLVGFSIPLEGFVRLQGYYLEEYGRLVGLDLTSSVTRNTAKGDPFCEWEHRLARKPATEAYVAALPEFSR
jgi:hypothetical protein